MAKKKGSKKVSKQTFIAEIQRLATQTEEVTRDFFRAKSEFRDGWTIYWPTFTAFLAEAGIKSTKPVAPSPDKQVELEIEKVKDRKSNLKNNYDAAVRRAEKAEEVLGVLQDLRSKTSQNLTIVPKVSSGTSESVAVMCASDWHTEENVNGGDVGYLNEFNLDVADKRITKFFQGQVRLADIMRKDTNILTTVLFLGGDFITNTIHEDAAESNNLLPADAIWWAQERILAGIHFVLDNMPKNGELIIVCHGGNHGRMTKKQRHSTELGNSLEQLMYRELKLILANEPRIKWQLAEGYHTFLQLFDGAYTIRFHHGHNISYGGGIGGITIPVNKAIAGWNQGHSVDLDVFGHFHQYIDAGNFVANGSLIGYNAYAVAIKAAFEKPTQAFFLVNRKWNSKTMATPIFVD